MKAAPELKVTTPGDRRIVMKRAFDAPRADVWRAMTEPALVRRWLFAPEGWSMSACEMDVRVGGAFRWAWNGPDGEPALAITGVHREVSPPRRLVHTERMEMRGACAGGGVAGDEAVTTGELVATLELDERDGVTTLTMTLDFPSKEARDGALASGMEHGVSIGYQRLDSILAAKAQR